MKTFMYFLGDELNYVKAVSKAAAYNKVKYSNHQRYINLLDDFKVLPIVYGEREDFMSPMRYKFIIIGYFNNGQKWARVKSNPDLERHNNIFSERTIVDWLKPVSLQKFYDLNYKESMLSIKDVYILLSRNNYLEMEEYNE